VEDSVEPKFQTISQLRRDALGQDFLLFCLAFSGGALIYAAVRAVTEGVSGGSYWTIGLSSGLLFSGLVAGEIFLIWDLGIRQGLRGHSVGKHRLGLTVVDIDTGEPAGFVRGAIRGVLLAILLDLTAAAVPAGLPTVLRETTPDSWHIGAATYIAALLLLVPVAFSFRRDFADRLFRTEIIRASGKDAVTAPNRRVVLIALELAGLLGVAAVMATYIAFYWPLFWQFPGLT
jgi:hypothetical protein